MTECTIKLNPCKICSADPKGESRQHEGLIQKRLACSCGQHTEWSNFDFAVIAMWQELNI